MTDILTDLQTTLQKSFATDATNPRLVLRPSFIDQHSALLYTEPDTDISSIQITEKNYPDIYTQIQPPIKKYESHIVNQTRLRDSSIRISEDYLKLKSEFVFQSESVLRMLKALFYARLKSAPQMKNTKNPLDNTKTNNFQQVLWNNNQHTIKVATETMLVRHITENSTVHQMIYRLANNLLQQTYSEKLYSLPESYRLLNPNTVAENRISLQVETHLDRTNQTLF
jgi:hypothetical protein